MSSNPYAPPKSQTTDVTPKGQAPALWNPNAAASWSLLFSPAFGAYLHMKNWQALGDAEKASNSRMWIYIYAGFIVLMALSTGIAPESKVMDGLSRTAGIALLIGWYYASGKAQVTYVRAEFGTSYPRKGWLVPIVAGIGAWLGVALVIGSIALAVASASGHA